MGFELDPLDDIFAEDTVKNAWVGGKFQPKAKQRPPRKDSAARSVSSSQSVPTSDVVECESSGTLKNDRPSEHCFHQDEQRNFVSVTLSSQNIFTIDRPNTIASMVSDSDVVMSDGNYSGQSNFDKSGESKDIFFGLKSVDDFLPHATANMETIAEGSTPLEATSVDVPTTNNAGLPIPVHSTIDASTCRQQSEVQDPLTGGEPIISISYDGDHMDNREVETEEMDAQVLCELATRSDANVDHALLRPGRFGKPVYVPLPSSDERGLILTALGRKKRIDANVDLMAIGSDDACKNLYS